MSALTKNQLSSRRGFIQKAVGAASFAGASPAFISGIVRADTPKQSNPWAYDDTPYRKTDPGLIHYQEIRRFQISRQAPRCICLHNHNGGQFLIGAGRWVITTTLDGSVVAEFECSDTVRCIAAAKDSTFVGFRDHIEVFDRTGQRKNAWETPAKKTYFTALALAESDLFAADAGNRLVIRYDLAGRIKGRIGDRTAESKSRGFIVPSPFFDVEVASDGLLRVSNPGRHCVETYTFDGDLEFSWGKPGAAIENFCGCCNPINLATMKDGRIVTFEKGIPRVKIYGSRGELDCVVAGAESFAENAKICGPNDCSVGGLDGVVDSQGRIHILDLVTASVRTMGPKAG